MKAKIFGFEVEGTPEELVKFKELMENKSQKTITYSPSLFVKDYGNPYSDNPFTRSTGSKSIKF
ncbi:hypothetical protein [Paenibacillus medicaginis]|uniref:Uncharacterized protein n=1 Tax=Paenibacillus medicaginis TaxID=1470560 RepID=A0ABV5BUZ0_9BACL